VEARNSRRSANGVKRLILVGVTKTDAAPIRDQGLLEGGGQVPGAKLPLSEEIDPGEILCLILRNSIKHLAESPMLSDLSLAALGALTERAARLSCECDTAGEWGAGTGDW
jgi:hypothetical protein